jgi:UMF1 family MFS transporter
VLGNGLGLGMGMIGTSSRATVGLFTPQDKTAEFFGLWGLTLKLAGFLGPPIFGLLAAQFGNRIGFITLSCVCVISAVLLVWLIDEKAGLAAARQSPVSST